MMVVRGPEGLTWRHPGRCGPWRFDQGGASSSGRPGRACLSAQGGGSAIFGVCIEYTDHDENDNSDDIDENNNYDDDTVDDNKDDENVVDDDESGLTLR